MSRRKIIVEIFMLDMSIDTQWVQISWSRTVTNRGNIFMNSVAMRMSNQSMMVMVRVRKL